MVNALLIQLFTLLATILLKPLHFRPNGGIPLGPADSARHTTRRSLWHQLEHLPALVHTFRGRFG